MRPYFLLIAPTLLLAACATAPTPPPVAAAPTQYKEAGLWQEGTANSAPNVPDNWWTLFQDPVLNDLESRLVVGNENLKSLVAQVAAARAAVAASYSARLPTLSVGLDGTRSSNATSTTRSTAVQNPSNNVSLSGNASWEVDLWGRLAQATTGAQASLQASVDDLAAARLSAQATLAQTYFSLRTADAQMVVLERSVVAYQRSLDLTQFRYGGGVAARVDVLQAQTQLKAAQAQLAEAVAQRAILEHAIAVLLGVPPSALALERNAALPQAPLVPQMLPTTLLERRPDIAAAQRRVAAAYAQIGVAHAAYFPSLVLSAGGGYQNSSLNNLISAPNLFWSLGASVAQAIFDGGQRQLASAQAQSAADQATSTYRQTVLTALQEVEDNLILAAQLQQEAQLQRESLEAAQRTLEITLDQYRAGTVSYLNVVIAQNTALTSENSLLSTQNRQLAAVNILLKNIAGRWEVDNPNASKAKQETKIE
ncbi:efflux transporter outer membrane subunit [Herminiimonas arsenitoxidans]|uniref:efflux transporter outer membrane subunit n=1 Tax=Herminiimonas arsenitoxidans TaxID=1809410 RepID=UPI000970C40C|nr:efflux transporter outer membrane subunit [Herminiimonas arsenitoxidans]